MARVTKTILGRLSGMVGDMIYRQFNGKTVVSRRSSTYTVPMDKPSVNRRSMFGFLMKYASAAGSMPIVKSCWAQKRDKGNAAFNRIVSVNYQRVANRYVLPATALTPAGGFSVTLLECFLTGSSLVLTLAAELPDMQTRRSTNRYCTLAVILSLHQPVRKKYPAYNIVPLSSPSQPCTIDQPLVFELSLTPQEHQCIKQYKSRLLLCAVIISENNKTVLQYSQTVYKKME